MEHLPMMLLGIAIAWPVQWIAPLVVGPDWDRGPVLVRITLGAQLIFGLGLGALGVVKAVTA